MTRPARSVFAVIDGLLLFLTLEGVFYAIAFLGLHRSFDTPTPGYLTANLIWALLAALAGGYTVARVARYQALLHGVVMALPLLLLGAYNLHKGIGNRNTPYVLAFNLLVPVCCVLGAMLHHARYKAARSPRG